MVEQVVEQKTADMWVLPGMVATVAEESRRQWSSLSMLEKQRRHMLTKPGEKNQADN